MSRSTMSAMALTATIAFSVALGPGVSAAAAAAEQTAGTAGVEDPTTVEMIVTGLSCPFCAYGLEKRMQRLEGLDALEIDPETGQVRLVVEDGHDVTEERIRELVNEAGFRVDRFTRAPWIRETG